MDDTDDLSEAELFETRGVVMMRGLVEPALVDFLWSYVHTKFASKLLTVGRSRLVPRAPTAYGDAAVDGLLEYLRPDIERRIGVKLSPTYSIVRLHVPGDDLSRHRDRAASEIVATVNIGQVPDEPWPFHVEGALGVVSASLRPGDAMIYRGHRLRHWREPFVGQEAVQAVLSYVDRDGPFSDQRFDGRVSLMRPPRRVED